MPTNILMPALSPTMEKGNLAKWLKKEGDKVKSGDVIAEIETDKATMEVEAADEGTLAKIVVPEGAQDVPVNAVIAVLAGEGEDVKAAAAGAAKAPRRRKRRRKRTERSSPQRPTLSPDEAREHAASAASSASPPLPSEEQVAARSAAGEGARRRCVGNRIFSSPLARRLAKEAGIDLSRVAGSGPHGRVIARDIDAAKSGTGLRAPGAAPGSPGAPMPPPAMPADAADPRALRGRLLRASCRTTACADHRAAADGCRCSPIPHFYLTRRLRHRQALGSARGDQRRRAQGHKTASPPTRFRSTTSSSRRWRWRCSGCPTPTSPGPKPACSAPAFRHRRGGGAPLRADHADRAQRREQIALRHLQRDEGPRRPRQNEEA